MRIRLLQSTLINGVSMPVDAVVDVPQGVANDLIWRRRAVKVQTAATAAPEQSIRPMLEMTVIRGIGESRAQQLADLGYPDVATLATANENAAANIASALSGIELATAQQWIADARDLFTE